MAGPALTHPPVPGTPGARGGGVASRRRTRPPAVLLVPALVAAGVALLPLVYLAVRAFERGPEVAFEIVWQERTLRLVLRSLLLAAVVTGLCLVVGVSLAWLTSRTRVPFRRLLTVLGALPLAVPSYVAAYIWVSFFPRIPPFAGSVLVLTLCTYPYLFLPFCASLQGTDPAL